MGIKQFNLLKTWITQANVRPRESFGTAFNNISIIGEGPNRKNITILTDLSLSANNSMHAPPSTANDSKTRSRKESTGSRGESI